MNESLIKKTSKEEQISTFDYLKESHLIHYLIYLGIVATLGARILLGFVRFSCFSVNKCLLYSDNLQHSKLHISHMYFLAFLAFFFIRNC